MDVDKLLAPAELKAARPAFQVIVLGSGGGPNESDTTGLLVRSTSRKWSKGSILAVDAGVHLSAIMRSVTDHLPFASEVVPDPTGSFHVRKDSLNQLHVSSTPPKTFGNPIHEGAALRRASMISSGGGVESKTMKVLTSGSFADLVLPYETPGANAGYILRNLISTSLITHPHLDHISGFVINTAAFQHTSRPKKLAALPSTIEALKRYIFNDIIWPNLSDEDGGVGLLSYQRLAEGGNIAVGSGESTGYIEVCDSLAVKAWSVSHGCCTKRHVHRASGPSLLFQDPYSHHSSRASNGFSRESLSMPMHVPNSPSQGGCIVDSSAFFIRDEDTGQELLIFGDVEPDSVSLAPRNERIWADAAQKITSGLLKAVFIECSYDDSQPDGLLFGHLNPRHLMDELVVLARKVVLSRKGELVLDPYPYENERASFQGHSRSVSQPNLERSASRSRDRTATATPTPTPAPVPEPVTYPRKRPRQHFDNADSLFRTNSPSRLRELQLREIRRASLQHSPTTSGISFPATDDAAQVKKRSLPDHLRRSPPPFTLDGNGDANDEDKNEHRTSIDTSTLSPRTHVPPRDVPVPIPRLNAQRSSASDADASADPSPTQAFFDEELRGVLDGLVVVIIHVKDPLRDGMPAKDVVLGQLRERERKVRLGVEFRFVENGEAIFV